MKENERKWKETKGKEKFNIKVWYISPLEF